MRCSRSLAALALLIAPLLRAQVDLADWKTDVSKRSIELAELERSVGRDAFLAVDRPSFASVEEAAGWLTPGEPVLVVEIEGLARAYPIQILLFHELVNDRLAGVPLLVSFCPLCNSAVVFDRRLAGRELAFGVSGFLRNSDMVIYDRRTETLWQQLTGEALVGELSGARLTVLGSQTVSFETFAASYPGGQVLEPVPGIGAPYGQSHYVGYEWGRRDFLPVRLGKPLGVAPLERVVALSLGARPKAYSFDYLRRRVVVESKIESTRYVILFDDDMLSAMDAERIADSRAVGSAGVFSPLLDGERLRFRRRKREIYDRKTGSRWDVLGRAVEGPLAGRRLRPIVHAQAFAFAWFVFYPETRLIGGRPEPGGAGIGASSRSRSEQSAVSRGPF